MNSKSRPRVALIFGGRGYEHDVSLVGADYVFSLVDRSEYELLPILIERDGTWLTGASGGTLPSEIKPEAAKEVYPVLKHGVGGILTPSEFIPLAAAIPLLHGDFGEDGVVQGALECAKISFVGCDTVTAAIARDKATVKSLAKDLGIRVAKWATVSCEDTAEAARRAEAELGYPVFVKPARLGSSVGASRAASREELARAIKYAKKFANRIILEEYIEIDRELECAYFAAKGKELFTNIGEVDCQGGFYDYEKKYSPTATAKVSDVSSVTEKIAETAREWSRLVVRALGIRDLSRVDYFLSKSGELYFNEINTFPGFTSGSLYPRLVARCGISPSELVRALIEESISRGA